MIRVMIDREIGLIHGMAQAALSRGVPLHPSRREALRRALLAWYRTHRRVLPWRSDKPDAYRVLVSEAMLQQTQVATVIAYFERFLLAFPRVRDLAAAEEQDVLRQWQGLGYYRRARNLHAAARAIVERHGGVVPSTVAELEALPGVGRYTAGAVASIAFGIGAPIVDGNVARVLSRWFIIEGAVDDKPVRDELWRLAAELVPAGDAGDFNQAMMELGAMVCTPRGAKCLACPVSQWCGANDKGLVDMLPRKREKRKPTAVSYHAVAVECDGRFLYTQRPPTGLWAGMWQFPVAEHIEGNASAKMLQVWLRDSFGLVCAAPKRVKKLEHQTTHRTVGVTLWHTKAGKKTTGDTWKSVVEAAELPASRLQRRCEELMSNT